MRDFTLDKYRILCEKTLLTHKPATVLDYITNKPKKAAFFRHDVDNKPLLSLECAKVENTLGIKSTYYFRTIPQTFKLDIIKEIHDLGHEIGFHYEVLDKAKGDYEKAIKLFEEEIKTFPYEIKTICMHGNPMTTWDNRDLWKKYKLSDYGIVGEAYLSIDYSSILYFSDTGRTWSGKYSVKDVAKTANTKETTAKSTDDLIGIIGKTDLDVAIVTHPQRWDNALLPWTRELFVQTVKNYGKAGIRKVRGTRKQ